MNERKISERATYSEDEDPLMVRCDADSRRPTALSSRGDGVMELADSLRPPALWVAAAVLMVGATAMLGGGATGATRIPTSSDRATSGELFASTRLTGAGMATGAVRVAG